MNSHLCQNILRFFGIKSKHNVCCICYCEKIAWWIVYLLHYVYDKLFTFINLHNNWIMSLGNFFVIGICELNIVQCKFEIDMWIFTNIQWLLFMNMCWRHFLIVLHFFLMIAYVCCSYPNGCNFSTYNICIMFLRCWSFSHLFGSKRILSPT